MRILSTLILVLFLSFPILSQEQIGLRLDNYSGVNGLMINPTQSVTSPFRCSMLKVIMVISKKVVSWIYTETEKPL